MNNKQLIYELKDAYSIDSTNKIRFIRSIKKPNTSLFSFIKNQFKLINKNVYISCVVYFAVLISLLLISSKAKQYITLAAGIPFFSLIIISIVNTSNRYNMEEIEMATLYSLKMVILARMVIMTFITMLLIIVMSILTYNSCNISFIQIISYFFIPYFLNMYIDLKVIRKYRNNGIKYCCAISSIICLLLIVLIENASIILLINKYVCLLVLLIFVALSIVESMNYINRLEDYTWNLN